MTQLLGRLFFLFIIFFFTDASADDVEASLIPPMIDWIRELGGTFSEKMEIRTAHGSGRYGVFCNAPIAKDEIILVIPREALITDKNSDFVDRDGREEYDGLWCPTAWNLIKEMRLGEESKYAPYIQYLLAQPHGQLPSGWSRAGMQLLVEVVGQHDYLDDNDLPPEDVIGWIRSDFIHTCHGDATDPLQVQAALLLLQRGWDDIMIPVYDLMSHRNGKWLNTDSTTVHADHSRSGPDPPIEVRATRDIQVGEEIYTTYNHCLDCGGRRHRYGTPEILRDYGFVENYPQRWYFTRFFYFDIEDVSSPLIPSTEEDSSPPTLEIQWLSNGKRRPPDGEMEEFRLDWLRLKDIEEMDLAVRNPIIPQQEWDTIVAYHQAMKSALEMAFEYWNYDLSPGSNGTTTDCESDGNDNVCSSNAAISLRYDELDWEEDETNYAVYTCDTDISMNFDYFDELETMKSHYQEMSFVIDRSNDNVCFDIGNTIQICGSYRPHYHEMVVHYTARFLKDIKRVIWVGGGDSMLLHEIIKYKSLEFVVGLEIDQSVTRTSFKHFGTQPHFDNPKVQWWYGDAAKSLLMLPKSYFGSFDMVLVDLSETVTSALVTDKLDIMQALSLLLKPDGILLKNELYMEQMAEIFRYSLQIHYNWVPVICSQCLILGSHRIDFLYESLTEHDLASPNLMIQPLDEIEDRYELYHDYRRNSSAIHLCNKEGDDEDANPLGEASTDEQQRSPGILMIVEVEDVTGVDLYDVEAVQSAIVNAMTKEVGLTNPAVYHFKNRNERKKLAMLSIHFGEGYIMVRTWPQHKYVALDVHFWSRFELQDQTKIAIVDALGGTYSSYRIVAGGMFGVSTWKQDEENRGPRVTDKCREEEEQEDDDTTTKTTMDISTFHIAQEETLKLLPHEGYSAAVVCGSSEECSSFDVLNEISAIGHVWKLDPCEGLTSEYQENLLESMMKCEKQLFKKLMDGIQDTEDESSRLRVLVLDPTASKLFARIVYKVLKQKGNRFLYTKNMLIMTAMMDSTNEQDEWKRHLLERFRRDVIHYDFNYRLQLLLSQEGTEDSATTTSSMELDITYSGEEHFVGKLMNTIIPNVQERTSSSTELSFDVRDIVGGVFWEDPEWEEEYFFLPQDYDQHLPLEQYMSQQPIGYQSVFQLEPMDDKNDNMSFTIQDLQKAIKIVLLKSSIVESSTNDENNNGIVFHTSNDDIGDGFVINAMFPNGNVLILWDGRKHWDINLFTYQEKRTWAKSFQSDFIKLILASYKVRLHVALKDVQPRGYGRVVNFQSDLREHENDEEEWERMKPHWAKFKEE